MILSLSRYHSTTNLVGIQLYNPHCWHFDSNYGRTGWRQSRRMRFVLSPLQSHLHHMLLMMTSSNGNISALLAICAENSPVPGEFPAQRPVTQSFDVFLDLRPKKRLSKQSWGWWFETLSCSLWRHRNEFGHSCEGFDILHVNLRILWRWYVSKFALYRCNLIRDSFKKNLFSHCKCRSKLLLITW